MAIFTFATCYRLILVNWHARRPARRSHVSVVEAKAKWTWTLRCRNTIAVQSEVGRFLWTQRVKLAEIHRRILAQYGSKNYMTQRKAYEWEEWVKARRTNVTDEARSSWPSTSYTQTKIDRGGGMTWSEKIAGLRCLLVLHS